jgi:hypothetical protein
LTTRPEQDVIAAIQALDLESVKLRVMDSELGEGWSRDYADSIEAAYKSYLTMLVKYPDDIEDIQISKDVDEFWHMHILHTMKYADDCQKLFGNFLHHEPQPREASSADIRKRSALAEKTRRLYQQESLRSRNTHTAYCNATAETRLAAYCNATMRAKQAAYCNATVRVGKPAYCNAAVRAEDVAYCNAAAEARPRGAYCNATMRAKQAAYCNATVRVGKPAYCNAAVRAEDVAYCNAAAEARPRGAYCNATMRAKQAAYCNATVHAG